MLCRMISRAARLPWKVPVDVEDIDRLDEPSFVIGVHEPWPDLAGIDATLVGLSRNPDTHSASLSRFGMDRESWNRILESLPDDQTVNYDNLVAGSNSELRKLRQITGVCGIEPEPWEGRYRGIWDWCRTS